MILGIDLGSTYFKAELFDHGLNRVGAGSASVPYINNRDRTRVEMDVTGTEEAFRLAIYRSLQSAGTEATSIRAVSIASQAQTFTVRTPDGHTRVPFISWRDTRTDRREPDPFDDFARHSSLYESLPLLMVSKLRWLSANGFGVQAEDLVLMLPTWFVIQLTGVAVVDVNLASMSGLYSFVENDWWSQALRACDLSAANMPALARLGECAGTTTEHASRYGLPAGIPVILAGNDQTAGAFGARIDEQNALLVTLGTAQVVYATCSELPAPTPGVMRGPYPAGRFYQLVADEHGSGTVDWACNAIDGCTDEKTFDRLARDGAGSPNTVKFIAGDMGGHWVADGISVSAAEKAHAVFVCLVDRLSSMISTLGSTAENKPLVLAGGGSNSPPWTTLIRERIGNDVAGITSSSPALGAARMAEHYSG